MGLNVPSKGFSKQRRAYSFVGDIFLVFWVVWRRINCGTEGEGGVGGVLFCEFAREETQDVGEFCRSIHPVLTGLTTIPQLSDGNTLGVWERFGIQIYSLEVGNLQWAKNFEGSKMIK